MSLWIFNSLGIDRSISQSNFDDVGLYHHRPPIQFQFGIVENFNSLREAESFLVAECFLAKVFQGEFPLLQQYGDQIRVAMLNISEARGTIPLASLLLK